MDDIKVKDKIGDGYRKCHAQTITPDEFGNDVKIYVSSHFYHGHSNMTIAHLRLLHKVLSKFLKKYDEAVDESDFPTEAEYG